MHNLVIYTYIIFSIEEPLRALIYIVVFMTYVYIYIYMVLKYILEKVNIPVNLGFHKIMEDFDSN